MTETLDEIFKASKSMRDWVVLPALSVPSSTIILPFVATARMDWRINKKTLNYITVFGI
jgi:hypothetical protein